MQPIDIEFRTMCRVLQEIELFLILKHTIKYSDIGLLRRLSDPLIVLFFGAKQHHYGREMLFYRWKGYICTLRRATARDPGLRPYELASYSTQL